MTTDYRTDIDGLRAVAVLLVVGFHTFPLSVPGGFIGVDVFFVISGYLITQQILENETAGTFTIAGFYLRRARRILPALALVLCATLAIGWFTLFPDAFKALGFHALASALFIPNFVFWNEAGYFGLVAQETPLLHLWSLGIEEQFYLVWPAFLLLLIRWRKLPPAFALAALVFASLAYSVHASIHNPVAAFYSPLSRLWELGAGGILASRRINVRYPETLALSGFVAIMAAAFTLSDQSVFPGLLALAPVGGTAMMIAGRSWVLGRAPFVALGLISYPLYLWHWPLLCFIAVLDFHTELAKAIAVVVSIVLAWLTTRYVEYPIRFGRWRHGGVSAAALANIAACAAGLALIIFDGVPQRFPAEIQAVLAAKNLQYPANPRGKCWVHNNDDFAAFSPECRDGPVLIWGDSYSGALATGFTEPYAQFSRNACLPLLLGTTDECGTSNAAVVDEILRLKPRRVVLFGRWLTDIPNWQSDPRLTAPLRETLRRLRAGINDVVVLGPSPLWLPSLPDLVYRYWRTHGVLPDRLTFQASDFRTTEQVMRAIASAEQVRFISMLDTTCEADECLTHTPASRSDLLVRDTGHLTTHGAAYLVDRLELAKFDPR